MYKPMDRQHSFLDFNQPMGFKMNPGNRWVKLVDLKNPESNPQTAWIRCRGHLIFGTIHELWLCVREK